MVSDEGVSLNCCIFLHIFLRLLVKKHVSPGLRLALSNRHNTLNLKLSHDDGSRMPKNMHQRKVLVSTGGQIVKNQNETQQACRH
jgi:hypothetical protein